MPHLSPVELGQTGILVSPLCFGTLSLSPWQANLSPPQGGGLLLRGLDRGIDFWDTADAYDNYPILRWALKRCSREVVVATKTYAYDAVTARQTLEKARQALDRDCIDIMLLHEQESALTLQGHRAALEWLARAREKGRLRAVGISTHAVETVRYASDLEIVDVIHPLVNWKGLGLLDGCARDMEDACARARARGKGIYTMKALGGGNLLRQARSALDYVRGLPWADSVAVGMQTREEVDFNSLLFAGEEPGEALRQQVERQPRQLHVASWCSGCGRCVQRCLHQALLLRDGRAEVNSQACILCGYCAGACPDFCIKIY